LFLRFFFISFKKKTDYSVQNAIAIRTNVSIEGAGQDNALRRAISDAHFAESVDAVQTEDFGQCFVVSPPKSQEFCMPGHSVRLMSNMANTFFEVAAQSQLRLKNLSLLLGKTDADLQYAALLVANWSVDLERVSVKSCQQGALWVSSGNVHAVNCSFQSTGSASIILERGSKATFVNVMACSGFSSGLEVMSGSDCSVTGGVFAGNQSGISVVDDTNLDHTKDAARLSLDRCSIFDNKFFGLEVLTANCKIVCAKTRVSRNFVGATCPQEIENVLVEQCKCLGEKLLRLFFKSRQQFTTMKPRCKCAGKRRCKNSQTAQSNEVRCFCSFFVLKSFFCKEFVPSQSQALILS
jgi:hypothetical protein